MAEHLAAESGTTDAARRAGEEFVDLVLADPDLLETEFAAIVGGLDGPPTVTRQPAGARPNPGPAEPAGGQSSLPIPAGGTVCEPAARPPPR